MKQETSAHLALWRDLYNQIYAGTGPAVEPTFNTSGWRDSYTGAPVPAEHMRAWVDQAVAQILPHHPRTILEIGCGTGLLLFRLAPHCRSYRATDISGVVLSQVQRELDRLSWRHVQLRERAADDLDDIAPRSCDIVILNSVIQYFPSVGYLTDVLEKTLRVLAPGGRVFIGDVRNFALLEAFHVSVELQNAPSDQSTDQVWERARRRIAHESELLVAPAFFAELRHRIPRIGAVEIRLKGAPYQNEMTCFRYDVLLHLANGDGAPEPWHEWLDWQAEDLSLEKLRRQLRDTRPAGVGLRGIPNARVLAAVHALELLRRSDPATTAGQLRQTTQRVVRDKAVEPDHVRALAEEFGYAAEISWSADGRADLFDVLLVAKPALPAGSLGVLMPITREHAGGGRARHANEPPSAGRRRDLIPILQDDLRRRLPDHMIPSAFVILASVPLTPHGKVDRHALPVPPPPSSRRTLPNVGNADGEDSGRHLE